VENSDLLHRCNARGEGESERGFVRKGRDKKPAQKNVDTSVFPPPRGLCGEV